MKGERRQTVCLEGGQSLGRREEGEKTTLGWEQSGEAEEACLKQVRKHDVGHLLCNDQHVVEKS